MNSAVIKLFTCFYRWPVLLLFFFKGSYFSKKIQISIRYFAVYIHSEDVYKYLIAFSPQNPEPAACGLDCWMLLRHDGIRHQAPGAQWPPQPGDVSWAGRNVWGPGQCPASRKPWPQSGEKSTLMPCWRFSEVIRSVQGRGVTLV